MSSAASDEEMEELVAALSDDTELQDHPEDGDEQDEDEQEEHEDDDDDYRHEASSPRAHSEETDEDDDELHIAARAGIRLLEENMHFREEVLRLHEQIDHVTAEKEAVEQSLADRDAQVAALSAHLREAILENQRVLSELSQAKDHVRASQEQLLHLEQQLQQRSPRRRSGQRLSPRRSTTFSRPLVLEEVETTDPLEGDAMVALLSPSAMQSPTATSVNLATSAISPTKPSTSAPEDDDPSVERRLSFNETMASPRRRPTLARLREIEAKYDEAHQRCNALKLELNFAQRRVSELKPLQSQLEHACRELEAGANRLAELEAMLTESMHERTEEQELIQSLRQMIRAYEQLNDPRYRRASTEDSNNFQHGESETADGVIRLDHTQQLERSDGAAEMMDLRQENERLLQPLKALSECMEEREDGMAITELIVHVGSSSSQASVASQTENEGFHKTDCTAMPETTDANASNETNDQKQTEGEDNDATQERHLWNHTNTICAALLTPSPTASREEEIDQELLCFALLRRLVDSWTTDKPKRMQLHDWLTTAIRGTGMRRALHLHELTSEIAMGFQTLLVPMLHSKFGVHVTVEKRLRTVTVTDLSLHVASVPKQEEKDTVQTAARMQRVSHSLLSVIDGEMGGHESDVYPGWPGSYSARRASRGYLST